MRWLRRRLASGAGADERGISMIEVILALSLLALLMVGMAASVGSGLRLTGRANGRQAATQLASRDMEQIRTFGYTIVALPSGTTYETADPLSPDTGVTLGPPNTFLAPLPDATTEELVEASAGTVQHKATETIGGRTHNVYRYVTWADAAKSHKRVTIVVQWEGSDPVNGGRNQIALSSLFSVGSVEYPGTTSSTTSSTTTTTSSTTTTTAVATCSGDTKAPTINSFTVASGTNPDTSEGYTSSSVLELRSDITDACAEKYMQFSNDGFVTSGPWQAFASPAFWDATPGDGIKTVSGRFKDGAGNTTGTVSASVIVDTRNPTWSSAPNLTVTRGKQGSKLTNDAVLKWNNTGADANMFGYRVFRRDGLGDYVQIAKVLRGTGGAKCASSNATCSYTDTGLVSGTGYRYKVVVFDKAGRNSPDSNEVEFSLA